MKALIGLIALPALLLPPLCLGAVLWQGVQGWNWGLLFGELWHGGAQAVLGGSDTLWPQLLGSLLLMAGACLIALPLALGVALYHQRYASTHWQRGILVITHLLQGVPPIVYGLAGLVLLVHLLHWGISLLAGQLILALIVLPLLLLNAIHALERIPSAQSESARALGLSDGALILRVWLPQVWPALLTGLLLAMARALAETAPILFTATVFSGVEWPDSWLSPVSSLQTHIFYLAQEGVSVAAHQQAAMAALLLTGLIGLLSLSAAILRPRSR
ncbi:MAG: ABC transporter permease subunit [Mariprofundales bacterium]